MEHPKDFKEVEALMSELMRISACNEAGDKLAIELQAKIAHLEAERDALRAVVVRTAETIRRQLDLIDERAGPSKYLDRRPVVQSLTAHYRRLSAAIAAKEPNRE